MGDVPQTRRRRDATCAHGRRQHKSFSGLPCATSYRVGADQRRHAVRSFAFDGRNGGAGDVDELEMRSGAVALRRREATGRGVVYLVERAMNMLKMDPEKCTAIIQGFGNVGSVAALSLAYKSGVKVVGISDHAA